MDIDQEAVRFARSRLDSARVQFLTGDSMALPFPGNSIDVIVCNHIYEHVPYADRLMDELYRVLKEDGLCYFSAGNRYMLIEGHYGLPFLSWLPKPIAHLYLGISGKGRFYYEEHLSLRGLRKLVRKFRVHDYTLAVIRDPDKFGATDLFAPGSLLHRGIRFMAPFLYPWIPTYIWVLTKR
jgi:ubiquinone/menaquinone biosynthesis C-methylase UbiE